MCLESQALTRTNDNTFFLASHYVDFCFWECLEVLLKKFLEEISWNVGEDEQKISKI